MIQALRNRHKFYEFGVKNAAMFSDYQRQIFAFKGKPRPARTVYYISFFWGKRVLQQIWEKFIIMREPGYGCVYTSARERVG